MRTSFAIISASLFVVACNSLPEIEVAVADTSTRCVTREAATGSNYLTRVPCAKDDGDHREAHEQADAIRDDQRSRELFKMKRAS